MSKVIVEKKHYYFWPLLKEYYGILSHYWLGYSVYLLAILGQVLAADILLPWLLKQLIDTVSALYQIQDPFARSVAWADVYWLFYFCAFALLLGLFFKCMASVGIISSQPWALRDLEIKTLKTLLQKPYDFFASNLVGALTAKVKRYSDSMLSFDFGLTRGIWSITIQFVAALAVVSYYSQKLAAVFLLWAIVLLFVSRKLLLLKAERDRAYSEADSRSVGSLADSIANYLSVKIFNRQAAEVDAFRVATKYSVDQRRKSWGASGRLDFSQGGVIVVFQIILLWISLNALQSGEITLGTLILVQTYLLKVGENLTQFGVHSKEMFRAIASASEMFSILRDPAREFEPSEPEELRVSKGQVEFKSVNFSYDRQRSVLQDFCLNIPAGQKVALVGTSGAGKTTLVKLLLRFHRPVSGQILIDQQDLDRLRTSDLMQIYSLVPQETFLFHRSIRDNIIIGSQAEVSEQQLEQVLRDSYLKDLIERLPLGLNQLVGERGVKLSGGERQRIAIARAMLKPAPILILDEATNSLDASSEHHVQLALDNLMRGRTTVIIAHKLSTITHVDRIIVLSQGKIAEEGTHRELIEKQGEYFRLWLDQQRVIPETVPAAEIVE